MIAAIIGLWGWHMVFLIAGVLGVLWAIGWWAMYKMPVDAKSVGVAEMEIITEDAAVAASSGPAAGDRPVKVARLLTKRTVWAMMIGFFCVNFMVTFFLTWFPTYLVKERGFDLLKLGVFGAIPPICAILGSYLGGFANDLLLKRGWSVTKARKTCLVVGMLACALIGFSAAAPAAWQALVLMSISYMASSFTITTIWCLPADVVPTSTVGVLGGTQNFFSNIGSALSPIIIGAIYQATGSFVIPLALAGIVCVVGALTFGLVLPKVEQIPFREDEFVAAKA